jgi:hypothetical protein
MKRQVWITLLAFGLFFSGQVMAVSKFSCLQMDMTNMLMDVQVNDNMHSGHKSHNDMQASDMQNMPTEKTSSCSCSASDCCTAGCTTSVIPSLAIAQSVVAIDVLFVSFNYEDSLLHLTIAPLFRPPIST